MEVLLEDSNVYMSWYCTLIKKLTRQTGDCNFEQRRQDNGYGLEERLSLD